MSETVPQEKKFTASCYVQGLRQLVLAPGEFFGELPASPGYWKPTAFLLVSSVLHAVLSLPFLPARPVIMGAVLFLNALLMPAITALLGFLVTLVVVRNRPPFSRFFALYAYSAGMTHVLSWIPFANWITEPWRWILIGIGMVRGCGFSRQHTVIVIVVSIVALMGFYSLLSPLLLRLKG